MTEPRPARSGCALALGTVLVAVGTLLLLSNLVGFPLAWLWQRMLLWLSVYWPILLILWGMYKVYQRIVHPDSARVGAGEVLLLVFLIGVGLTVHLARRLVADLPVHITLDDVIESIDSDLSYGPAYSFEEDHRFELPAETGLVVDNRHGSVTVRGWDEPDLRVQLTKRVYRHSQESAAEIAEGIQARLDTPSEGSARLYTEIPPDVSEAETDLDIWIPRATPLTLSNDRGPLRVSDLSAPVDLATSNDSIEARDIKGSLNVKGRRGPIRIERIDGNVEALNRYGSLTIQEIRGNVIGETTNDVLFVQGVTGTAKLMNRHSRIRAANVGGDLTIEATQTEIYAEGLKATASIETSYRPIFVKAVEGRLTIDAHSSEIEVREAKGNIDVSTIYRSVTAIGVAGGANVAARKGAVRLEDIAGPVEVESSYHPVNVTDFQSSLTVRAEHAPLAIATRALGGRLELLTSYGDVQLALPKTSSFRLEARVKGGEVICDFRRPGWERSQRDEVTEVRGSVGEGAAPISIETSYGDIEIKERSPQ